ncbi:MAG TPA: carboxypeptidase regulatory-like domain-containing protein [Candidatus Angelobacter sp.]|nr:carboxypeptidase regulatory-like domain-containing protein [Candidatus Angelobacter sp.]
MNHHQHPVKRLAFAIAMLALLCAAPLLAQVVKGSISGTVTDPQGAVVSGATVKAINAATAATLATTSDNSGTFHFNLIPVGTYKVEVTATGFKTTVQNNIVVAAGRDSGLGAIPLTVGEVTTAVEVTADAPLIETTQSQVTNTFAGTQLTTFAGVTENQGLDNLALFVPGVVAARDNGFSNTNGGTGFSVNGLRGRNNDQQIDGQNNNDNSIGGPGLFVSDTEFVQQYILVTSQFGPEYGRNAGSVVNIITKSGSNAWHGSIYEHENNTILNSMTNFQKRFATDAAGNPLTSIPRANDEFGGFTIGGPIVKNKLFFFGGFDQQLIDQNTLYTSAGNVPTPNGIATLSACFPGSPSMAALKSFGPYAISAGNPTPFGTFIDNSDPSCPGVELGGVERTLPTHTHNFNWVTRMDLQLGSDAIMGRYLFNRGNNFNIDTGDAAAGFPVSVPALSQAVLLGDTHNFSTHVVNELRVGFNRLNVVFATNTIGTVPSDTGVDQAITRATFTDPSLLPFGLNGAFPEGRIVNTWQGQDNLNWVRGKHTFKAGVNYTYQRSPNTFLPNLNGAFRFADWEAFAADTPNRVRIAAGTPTLDFREHDTFLYAGDDWKVRQNLTMNLGLTWTYYGQPANLFNDLTTQRESNPATAFWRQDIPLSERTSPKLDAPTTSFGPSLGFAYTPSWGGFLTGHGKTVFRGGYRFLYDPPFYNIYLNIANSAPVVFLNTFTGSQITPSMILPAHPFGPDVRAELSPQLQKLVFDPRSLGAGEVTISPNFGPDKVNSWNFGFEREITRNSALELRYVGNHAYNLFQTVNGNPIVTGNSTAPAGLTGCTSPQVLLGPGQTVNPALGRADCSKGLVLERNNGGFSNYHGLQAEFRANNLFKQLGIRAAYTYSRTLDNVSEIFSSGVAGTTLAFAQNPWDTGRGEYSFSGLDIPHQVSIAATEQLPFFKTQHGLFGHVLGGWAVSANYIWASGQRYTPLQTFAEAASTAPSDNFDFTWLANNVGVDVARPFVGNLGAPASSVGVYGSDACFMFGTGDPTVDATIPVCNGRVSPTALISLNSMNATGIGKNPDPTNSGPVPGAIDSKSVRYIINGAQAQSVFGTPFGARRNLSQDAPTNIANLALFKNIKLNERASLEFNATLQNVFNHPNFQSIDPNIEDAGLTRSQQAPFVGFADPSVTNDVVGNALGNRIVRVGLTFRF